MPVPRKASLGFMKLSSHGTDYLNTNCVIYLVEKIAPYCSILHPLQKAVAF